MKRVVAWLGGAAIFVLALLAKGIVHEAFRAPSRAPTAVTPAPAPQQPPVDQAVEIARWNSDVASFLQANCDLRLPPNLDVMQEWIEAVAKVNANPSNSMMLERGADLARHDPRYRPIDCR